MNRLLMALIWTALVVAACAWPSHRLPIVETVEGIGNIKHLDKVAHAAIFSGFGFLWVRVGRARSKLVPLIIAGVVLSAATELIQLLPSVGRDASWGDFAADLVGMGLGLAAGLFCPDTSRSTSKGGDLESGSLVAHLSAVVPEKIESHHSLRSNS